MTTTTTSKLLRSNTLSCSSQKVIAFSQVSCFRKVCTSAVARVSPPVSAAVQVLAVRCDASSLSFYYTLCFTLYSSIDLVQALASRARLNVVRRHQIVGATCAGQTGGR
ncbi:hypothetical protein M407DRAFT_245779 [Tulasnella calospora MUT 4182]|uniref:Uncharacterized protein n=1 Tax=Tulasnella calospora MUT 4182 TaxID=1051891 RepID=A0A0C3LGC1_9AGAM|nr:hypothetical protein M407DRAFT_245779 [Tulasnella calospora MUT 4182]